MRAESTPAVLAYDRRAEEYAQLLGSMEATAEADRELIGRWADSLCASPSDVPGRYAARSASDAALPGVRSAGEAHGERLILDVGCGPGHWSAWLDERLAGRKSDAPQARAEGAAARIPPALRVEGIDPAPAFVSLAQSRFPGTAFRLGRAEELGVPDASVHGVLAWYSLIHTAPEAVPAALAEFARVLVPGGSLLLGFFEGPRREPFGHAVAQAWYWPVPELAALVEAAGFAVEEAHTRQDPGVRAHGALLARRV
jgi:ubiquinone/menaquinone biosynthesis C-methylase UbiE